MKLPSLNSLLIKSTGTLKRFPVSLLFTFIGAAIAIIMIHNNYNPEREYHYLSNLIMTCYLGMLLFIAITIYAERKQWNISVNRLVQLAGLVLLAVYYFSLPDYFMLMSTIRFALFSLALHLLIAFAPYLKHNEINGFWQYNKSLFLRIIVTALYSVVLFAGLALAIAAVDQLFKVEIDGKAYAYLWVMIATIFNTWFFLAGFPNELSALETKADYPKGLKIFTQFVLLPLIVVYLLILYSYLFKIVVQMQWPDGWVSYLVLFFSVAGILSLLLIHPVRNDESNKWIPVFSRFFYFAIFPLIVLLFFAIKRRISDYGITEQRYFVLLLALWLLFIASYFLASKSKNIKLIPVSLSIIVLLSSFGPWGAFSVSLRSQKKHLTELLTANKLMSADKINGNKKKAIDTDREITSVVSYLIESHGYQAMQDYVKINLDSLMKSDSTIEIQSSYKQTHKILDIMGINYVTRYATENNVFFSIKCENEYSATVSGYDFFISDFSFYDNSISKIYMHDTIKYTVDYTKGQSKIFLSFQHNKISLDFKSILDLINSDSSAEQCTLPVSSMTVNSTGLLFSAKLIVTHISGNRENKNHSITNFSAAIFIKEKEANKNEKKLH